MALDPRAPYQPSISPLERVITVGDCKYYTYIWKRDRDPSAYKGRILFIHGYRDSQQVYYYTFEKLTEAGYDVFYFDQRGEGKTVLTNGKKGTASEETALGAVDYFIEFNLKELADEGKPSRLSILSVSMGGGIALNYSAIGRYRKKLTCIVNIAPLILLHEKTYPGIVTETLVRGLCVAPFMRSLHVKTYIHPEYIAGDPVYEEYLRARMEKKPLYATLVESRDFVLRGRRLLSEEYYGKVEKELPILICHGDADYVNDVEGSKKFFEKVNGVKGMKNKRLIIYPKGRHVLYIGAEETREKALKDTIEFLDEFNGAAE
ncbi:DEKNAAC103735 [Brettanomyces naardenensis]|uniref:DEKNAAC103735 n=1 Tax=Brettanomyces naardenensis TaxID=13370 RepID=A0A448YP34_BRENA|nr:DEKNAAC103735 [Brettanomyces naardenensis]